MSMFADYFKEQGQLDTIENENGFVVYQIFKDEFFIKEYYIIPEKRMGNAHVLFFEEIHRLALEAKCSYVSCSVDTTIKDPETPLIFNLKNGFKIHSLSGTKIILTRSL